jgi:Rad3-related DNA helicase
VDPDLIPESFPAPEFRGRQQRALSEIRDAFAAGNDVVLVRAPTGSGKSLLARSIAGAAATVDDASPADATGAYYTTPQVSQLDDVAADPLLADLNVIRGKSNYTCILNGETDTPVDRAPCARQTGFDCSVRHRCPYFSDRSIASNRAIAAMTLAYFMQTAGSEVFRKRDVVVIDEAHGLAEWAEMYATVELAPSTVPVWNDIGIPDVTAAADAIERTVGFAETLAGVCKRAGDDLTGTPELTPEEAARRDRLQELRSELNWFVSDARDPESPTTWVVDQPDGAGTPITIKPVDPARYLHHTVWDRGNNFALLSATILNKRAFCRGVGLDPSTVALVDVDHTFPVENRTLYDVARGKMTYDSRDETLPKVAKVLVRIAAAHPDEKGLVHCHSYAIQSELRRRLVRFGLGGRIRAHDREDRDSALESWKATDDPDVFLSVKMEEALDLGGELCRWQVLCKAPYLNTNDSRVARRLEEDQWPWYRRTALRTVIQACGRVVRAPDDYGATYLADSSILDLFDRTRGEMPGWFRDQVDRLSVPDLPGFETAADAVASSRSGRGGGPSESTRGTGHDPGSVGRGSGGSADSTPDGDGSGGRGSASGSDHPLSDVWGDG